MDRRLLAYKALAAVSTTSPVIERSEAESLLRDGAQTEFWQAVKTEIDQQIRAAESRFLDTLAKDYETYVAWWSRRQALIAVLAIPKTATPGEV